MTAPGVPASLAIEPRPPHRRDPAPARGESVAVEEVEAAMVAACRRAHAEVVEFTVAPRKRSTEDPRGGHDWLVEFAEPPRCPLDLFTRALDEALSDANPAYRVGRVEDAGLMAPRLVELPAGTFERWTAAQAALGGVRVPHVTADRRLARSLLATAARVWRARERPSLAAAI